MAPCEFCHHREAGHIPECIYCPVGAPCLFYVAPEDPPEPDAPGVPVRSRPLMGLEWQSILNRDDMELRLYNAMDCERTWEAAKALDNDLDVLDVRATHDLMLALARPAYRMQERGLLVDPDKRKELFTRVKALLAARSEGVLARFNEQVAGALDAAAEIGGFLRTMRPWGARRKWVVKGSTFNVRSKAHLTLLLTVMGMKWTGKTPSGRTRLDLDTIAKLRRAYPQHDAFLALLWEYAKLEKLRGDWLEDGKGSKLLCTDGRMRASIRVCGTASGRFSEATREWCARCQEPEHGRNRQNLPKTGDAFCKEHAPIRSMIIPGPGRAFVEADYSALEAWIAALMSGDQEFIARLRSGSIHAENARDLFQLGPDPTVDQIKSEYAHHYRMAKIFLYGGILYLGGPETIQASFERDGLFLPLGDFKKWIARWKVRHQRYVTWTHEAILDAQRVRPFRGRTALGRQRLFWGKAKEWSRDLIAHKISGTGADYVNHALVELDELWERDEPNGDSWLLLHGHDSLLTECAIPAVPDVAQSMYDAFTRDRGFGVLGCEVQWSTTTLQELKPWDGLRK